MKTSLTIAPPQKFLRESYKFNVVKVNCTVASRYKNKKENFKRSSNDFQTNRYGSFEL